MGTICNHSGLAMTPRHIAERVINRRTFAQAAASLTAMAVWSGRPKSATAAEGTPTLAAEWVQPNDIGGEGQLGFTADFPFHAIAPHWPGDTDFDAAVELQVSEDGATWTQPQLIGPAHTDAGPADRDDRIYGQLAFTPLSSQVRYRTLDANGNETGLPGLQFTYIDATGGPGLDDISTESPVPSLQRPPIISREEWGANLTYGGAERGASEWIPQYQTVEHVIIHHSETMNFRDPLAEIRSIHYYHAITRGWGDIGYNYLVDFMGNVYEGRVGGDNVVGGHAYQYAYGSSGICAMGSFKLDDATPEMISGLTWITAWAGRYLDPLAKADFHEQPNLPTICGHRDVNDSTCPGDGLYADLPYIREAVAAVLAGTKDVVPSPDFSPGQIVETTVDAANLREMPGTSEDILMEVPIGAVFQVIEGPTTVDDNRWYRVRGDTGDGWLAVSTFEASSAAPPAGQFAAGDEVVFASDLINIRDKPTLKGSIVATVAFMSPATILDGPMPANGYTWYKVQTTKGTGWATEQYLSFEADVAPPVRFVVGDAVQISDPEGVRLRSAPSTTAKSIASLSPGTTAVVVDGPKAANGYSWLSIQTKKSTGWVVEEYLDASESAPPPDPEFAAGDEIVVDTDAVNLRKKPGASNGTIGSLGTGTRAAVIKGPEYADNLAWYYVETGDQKGWVVGTFFVAADDDSTAPRFEAGNPVYVNTDALNLRESASMSANILATLPNGAAGTIADGPKSADDNQWYQVKTAKGTGWMAAQFLGNGTADPSTIETFAIGDAVSSTTDAVNIRKAPGLQQAWVAGLYPGETAKILKGPKDADGYTWYEVSAPSGTGWAVRNWFAHADAPVLKKGTTARVFDGELNLRAAGSLGADVVAILPDATYVDILAGPETFDDNDWYRVSTSRYGTGWVAGRYLIRT